MSSALFAQTRRPQPLAVSGIVPDAKGRPLEGANVRLNADFVYGRAEATTGADGRYAISGLIKATYRAEAWIETQYAGSRICPRLPMQKPTDYNSFPVSQSAERNFRRQLTRRIGFTDSYFDATISICSDGKPLSANGRAVELRVRR